MNKQIVMPRKMDDEYPAWELPIAKQDTGPPFKDLILAIIQRGKQDEQANRINEFEYDLEQALNQIREYWYSRGLKDMDRMTQTPNSYAEQNFKRLD